MRTSHWSQSIYLHDNSTLIIIHIPRGRRTDGHAATAPVTPHVPEQKSSSYNMRTEKANPGHIYLQQDRHKGRVPVVGHEHTVLSGTERQSAGGLDSGLAEEAEALVVVDEVSTRLGTVELGTSLAPHLGQEPGMVHEDTVHSLLDSMEEPDLLTVHVDDNGGIPAILILIIPALQCGNQRLLF